MGWCARMTSESIRLATSADAAPIAEIYRPAVTSSSITFELDAPSPATMAARIARTLERTPWLVYERDGEIQGYAYASQHRERPAYQWSVDVSCYVAEQARRTGVARALYTALFEILKLQGFRNAYAGITLPNPASEGLHRAMGFTPVGVYKGVGYKLGAWHDVGWFERQIAPRIADPPPPRPLPDCLDDPAFQAALRGSR